MPTPNKTIGDTSLSAWLVAPGVCWVQTRSPLVARKLSQRADSKLVARGVAGGYLRTFEFRHGLAWAGRLIARYTQKDEPTNAPFLRPISPSVRRSRPTGIQGRMPSKEAVSSSLESSQQPFQPKRIRRP